MELSKIVEQILKITNESPYGRLDMDSSEAGEIWKILNKELQQGQSLPIDSVSQRSELLADYNKFINKQYPISYALSNEDIENYEANCG